MSMSLEIQINLLEKLDLTDPIESTQELVKHLMKENEIE
jgi:hypothetical protein